MTPEPDVPRYEGACHCGGLCFVYRTDIPPSAWSLRVCSCSFCKAHRGIATSHPAGQIEFRETIPGALQRYRFGHRSADFLVCSQCGVHVGVVMEDAGDGFGIINLNALREVPERLAPPQRKDFEGETLEQRVARRKANWARARILAT